MMTDSQKSFINKNYRFMTQSAMGRALGVKANTVAWYMKKNLGYVPREISKRIAVKISMPSANEQEKELHALVHFTSEYPSFKQSAIARIKFLERSLNDL